MISITTGIDIVQVSRFRKNPFKIKKKFYMGIFNDEEIEYCCKFKDPYPHFAGKFALKESFQKAARKQIAIKDIHTKHGSVGEPIIDCHSLKYKKIDSSVSHEKDYAIAMVMIFW